MLVLMLVLMMMMMMMMMMLLLMMMMMMLMDLGASHRLIRISLLSLDMSNFCRVEVIEFSFDPCHFQGSPVDRGCFCHGPIVLQEFDLTAANDRFGKLDTPETGTSGWALLGKLKLHIDARQTLHGNLSQETYGNYETYIERRNNGNIEIHDPCLLSRNDLGRGRFEALGWFLWRRW